MLALAKIAIQPNMHPLSSLITPETRTKMTDNAYPVFASMTWAMVMYIWRWHPETLASSLRSSMVYMYVFCMLVWENIADFDLVMVTRIIGILCVRYCCIINEGVFLWVTAYRAVMMFGVFENRCASVQTLLMNFWFKLYYEAWSFLVSTSYYNTYITLMISTSKADLQPWMHIGSDRESA